VTAPGPGRFAALSTIALYVGWMQKVLASVLGCGSRSVESSAGLPKRRMVRADPPKARGDRFCRVARSASPYPTPLGFWRTPDLGRSKVAREVSMRATYRDVHA
jgi:hypothetical protein